MQPVHQPGARVLATGEAHRLAVEGDVSGSAARCRDCHQVEPAMEGTFSGISKLYHSKSALLKSNTIMQGFIQGGGKPSFPPQKSWQLYLKTLFQYMLGSQLAAKTHQIQSQGSYFFKIRVPPPPNIKSCMKSRYVLLIAWIKVQ